MADLIRMDEYCSSVRDGTHNTPKPTNCGYYLVTSKAIKNETIDLSDCYLISEKDFFNINKRSKVDKWDVIMTMIGTVGRLHLVKDEPEYAIKNIALFKIGDEDRAKWLYYYLSTTTVQNHFELIASGTSQHFIGLGHLRSFKIENYRNNSKQITNILSSYDNLIEINNKRIKALEQMAEKLYKEWFVRFRFPGHETAEFENGIPKGWFLTPFGTVCQFERGISYSSEEIENENADVLLINLKNIKDYGGFRKENFKTYQGQFKDKQVLQENDLVMAITEMVQERRIIGYVGLIPTYEKNSVFSSDLIKLTSQFSNLFLYTHLTYGGISRFFSQFGNGTNVIHLRPDSLLKRKILMPDKITIDRFVEKVSPIFCLANKLQSMNETLTQQRNLLLPRLMSGKLEV